MTRHGLVFLFLMAALFALQGSDGEARPTDIQTQTRNTKCPPPPGAPPGLKNWSCRTGTQNPFEKKPPEQPKEEPPSNEEPSPNICCSPDLSFLLDDEDVPGRTLAHNAPRGSALRERLTNLVLVGQGLRTGPIAGAAPQMNFLKGFTEGTDSCLKEGMTNPISICLVMGAIIAKKFNQAAALVGIVATGRVVALGSVMQNLQEDINASPDPYKTGIAYGRRFCIWLGAGAAFLPARGGAAGNTEPTGPAGRGGNAAQRACPSNAAAAEETPIALRNEPVTPSTGDTWLPEMNETGCTVNCGYLAAGVDAALAGRGVNPAPPEAAMRPSGQGDAGVPYALLQEIFGRQFMNMSPAQIEQAMLQGPANARGILYIWKPGATMGHFLNIAREGQQIYLLDGQIGRLTSWQQLWSQGFRNVMVMPTN